MSTSVKKQYKRDQSGHLMCGQCDFKPKTTSAHPLGNPSTLHYHLKKHEGDFAHVCPVCSHGFLHKVPLDTHMASRHPEYKQEPMEMYACPLPGCDFESLTKANRRIHFVRKHCNEIVHKYCKTHDGSSYECIACNEIFKSSTSFHYHIGGCFVKNGIAAHDLLINVC